MHVCRPQREVPCDAPLRRGSACHPAGTAHTADAPGCTGRGCASRRGHTCGVQPGHGRTSRSVWPPPWRAPRRTCRPSAWDSRDTNRGAWALWAPFHLLPGIRKATAGVAPRWLRLILLAILMIHYGATLIQYIELSCFLGDGKFPQRPIVETVDVLDGIAHVHGDLLPGHEAQIPLL